MTGYVLDASAYVLAYTETTPVAERLRARIGDGAAHAPHLIVAEVGSVARRMAATGAIKPDRAVALVEEVSTVTSHLYPHAPLVRLAWSLRDTISFYDALYVSLAAVLGVPLLTADARLARARGLPCDVEMVS